MEKKSSKMQIPVIKRWNIENLLENKNLRQAAKDKKKKFRNGHNYLTPFSTENNHDTEVEQFEKKITELLNNYAKKTKLSAYFKQWWNKEEMEAMSS